MKASEWWCCKIAENLIHARRLLSHLLPYYVNIIHSSHQITSSNFQDTFQFSVFSFTHLKWRQNYFAVIELWCWRLMQKSYSFILKFLFSFSQLAKCLQYNYTKVFNNEEERIIAPAELNCLPTTQPLSLHIQEVYNTLLYTLEKHINWTERNVNVK